MSNIPVRQLLVCLLSWEKKPLLHATLLEMVKSYRECFLRLEKIEQKKDKKKGRRLGSSLPRFLKEKIEFALDEEMVRFQV